jgi:hypothetical protein
MIAGIRFTSYVGAAHRSRLEALVFFNASQTRVLDGIVDAIERFGSPEIVQEGDRLRVRVAGETGAQALFAVEGHSGKPLGFAVYLRSDLEKIVVMHLGIDKEFSAGGPQSETHLLFRLLRELRRSGRRLKGVRRLEVAYLSGRNSARGRTKAGIPIS